MRMKKSNKKLAIMVGMALSMGVSFGFAPGDAYAAEVTKQDGTYYFGDEAIETSDAYSISDWFKDTLAAGNVDISFADFEKAADVAGAGMANGLSLGADTVLTIGSADGANYYKMSAGTAGGSLSYADGAFGGSLNNVEIDVQAGSENFAFNGSIDTLTIKGSNDGDHSNSVELIGEMNIGTLNVESGGMLQVRGGDENVVKVTTLNLESGAKVYNNLAGTAPTNIEAENIIVDASDEESLVAALGNMHLSGVQKVTVQNAEGGISEELSEALSQAGVEENANIVDKAADDAAGAAIGESLAEALNAINKVDVWAGVSADAVAAANPFATKLPAAEDLDRLTSSEQVTALQDSRKALEEAREAAEALTDADEKERVLGIIDAALSDIPADASQYMKVQKEKLTAAVQQAGKTAAAPGVTSARAATAITNVLTNNVVNRTAEIRGFASAVDEGRPAPDKMWFQYKHTNMDVDGGDVYDKSTINTNNFQLGYDTQIGENDYLGAYIGTTTGNADFNGPAQNGRIDIDNAFDFGVYGTHMLPNDQYIDYMIHTGKFDSEYDSSKWGTTDTGAMLGYGAKIAQNDRLTLNPYVQLAYDKISVDSYATRSGNVIKSDDSNNWTAKLGVNLIDASGLYGGVAYSRGLSGSYNAYINGVAMPTNDYNANVLYLSLGYRASMAKNAVLDLSMEKTFMDYKGWTAAGKVNFYF
ncbi:MAG: autotransporter outer membrane beta-barrel domain-containing protein [Anaerovibrio sp.]